MLLLVDGYIKEDNMILVTLGTQDKEFTRLLKDIDNEIKKGTIKDKVVVQAGYTKYKSKNMEIIDYIPVEDFDKYIKKCDLLITHGGVGSIITGLNNDKKVIACARLKKYGEHTNDHQLQIIENFSKEGYILSYGENDKLGDVIKKSKTFKPNKYISNKEKMQNLIKEYIDDTPSSYSIIRKMFILVAFIMLIIMLCI